MGGVRVALVLSSAPMPRVRGWHSVSTAVGLGVGVGVGIGGGMLVSLPDREGLVNLNTLLADLHSWKRTCGSLVLVQKGRGSGCAFIPDLYTD